MPIMTTPACGCSMGSKSQTNAGIETAIAKGGARRGWSDYDALRETLTLVYEQATAHEVAAIRNDYRNNRLTGGMTFSVPWVTNNWALASNGATIVSTGDFASYPASGAISGNLDPTAGIWWTSALSTGSRRIEVTFAASKTLSEIVLVTLRDTYLGLGVDAESDNFSIYGAQAFTIEYWTGSAWAVVTGGTVTGNNKVIRRFPIALTTTKIAFNMTASPDGLARVVALQANSKSYTADYITEPLITPGAFNSNVVLMMRT